MAKDNERKLAEAYYIAQGLTAKEIAGMLHVSEKTVGDWVKDGKWKELKLAKDTGPDALINQYNILLQTLVTKRITLEKEKKFDEVSGIIDEISKISKAVDNLQKSGKPTLRIYINCLEKFMSALYTQNTKLYFELIDFQREHLRKVAEELK